MRTLTRSLLTRLWQDRWHHVAYSLLLALTLSFPLSTEAQNKGKVAWAFWCDCDKDGVVDVTADGLLENQEVWTQCNFTCDQLAAGTAPCGVGPNATSALGTTIYRAVLEKMEGAPLCKASCSAAGAEGWSGGSCRLPAGQAAISVRVDFPPYELRNDLTTDELTRLFGAEGVLGGKRRITMPPRPDGQIGAWEGPSSGSACAAATVEIVLGLESIPRLYVASDLAARPACHAAVLRHEIDHYDLAKKLTEKYARRLEAKLKADALVASAANPRCYSSKEEFEKIKEAAEERVKALLAEQLTNLMLEWRVADNRLDSPERYAEIDAVCGN